MADRERTVKLYEVLADTDAAGPAGDGVQVFRFHDKRTAEDFAARSTSWGNPTKAIEVNAPLRIARRWGMA